VVELENGSRFLRRSRGLSSAFNDQPAVSKRGLDGSDRCVAENLGVYTSLSHRSYTLPTGLLRNADTGHNLRLPATPPNARGHDDRTLRRSFSELVPELYPGGGHSMNALTPAKLTGKRLQPAVVSRPPPVTDIRLGTCN